MIVRALSATDAGILPRAAAAFAAGHLGLTPQASELAGLVNAPDPLLSSTALVALARLSPTTASELVAQQLLAAEPEARPGARAAALALATSAYRRTGPLLPIPRGDLELPQVLAGLLPDAYDANAERAALTRLGPALELAAAAAVRSGPEGARAVADALSTDGGRLPFSTLLVRAANDPSARKEAEGLAERIAERTVPAFVALAEHPAVEVRSFALGFLGRRPEAEAARAVVAAINDADPGVRRAVLASLGPAHAAAAPQLIAMAGSDDWSLRVAAVEALGRLVKAGGPPNVLAALSRAASKDDTALVREAALTAFSRAAPELSESVLVRARDSDPEPHVRKTAEALLRSAKPKR